MLQKVGFQNFLALRNVELTLEPFTVIVGPNASGKSSILEGIQRISYLEKLPIDFLNLDKSININTTNTDEGWKLLQSKNQMPQPISFSFQNLGGKNLKILIESSYRNYEAFLDNEIHVSLQSIFGSITPLKSNFQAKTIRFSAKSASNSSYSKLLSPILEESGQGLATIFSDLQGRSDEKFELVQSKMLSIIPNLTKIRIRRSEVPAINWFNITDQKKHFQEIAQETTATGQELLFDFVNATGIPASRVSEGTLFALTVLVAVASSEGDTVVLIDDLERGLHPKAVRDLMKALRDIQAITPGLQIIATSHSPYVLHELEPKEVRVVTLDPELGTLIAPLEAYPNFDQWRNEMTPGEFWSFVGEDWVKDLFLEKSRA
jgi:AAA15 family ATPase/GTPase